MNVIVTNVQKATQERWKSFSVIKFRVKAEKLSLKLETGDVLIKLQQSEPTLQMTTTALSAATNGAMPRQVTTRLPTKLTIVLTV